MALLKIVKHGDPVLRRKCAPIQQIDKGILELIDNMFETMYDAPGIGLAANQVGIPLRLAVIDIQENGKKHRWSLSTPKSWNSKDPFLKKKAASRSQGFFPK